MTIDLTQLHSIITAVLPFVVAFVAGLLRQDKFPALVNELIAYSLVVAVAATNALFDGRIGGSPLADFMIVATYASASINLPLFKSLQGYLQSNVFSFGKPAVQPAQAPQADVQQIGNLLLSLLQQNAPQLASLVASELTKYVRMQQSQPQASQVTSGGYVSQAYPGSNVGVAQTPIDQRQTQAPVQAVRTSTPPYGG